MTHTNTTQLTADPLQGYSPDEIVVGPAGQTLTQAAAEETAPRCTGLDSCSCGAPGCASDAASSLPADDDDETVTYCYVDGGEQRSAEHRCTTEQAIAAAVDHLDAIDHDGGYAYRAEETGSWYAVTSDDMAELGAAVLAGRASAAYSLWCAGCGQEIDDPTGATVRCARGDWSGHRCSWAGPASETVLVECMPEHLRASHEAAGNRGVYPHNGARRIRVERSCADAMVEQDGEWCEIAAER